MKLQFNPELDFQIEAVKSIADIFEGQETCRTNFTVAPLQECEGLFAGQDHSDLGIGNRLRLLDEDILKNVNQIQLRNGLAPTEELNGMNFTVEMETGTGKTYVYLRTIFELNRRYGFTKFIIVVPSVAIKEGVYKSLEITEEHFKGLYDNVQFDDFVYDSQKLGQVRNFATSDCIQIMVINIDAFRKSFTDPEKEDKANIIHRPHDRMTGSRPIEFIQSTNPIVIIDEPQSVDTTQKSREAIASLNPLCTLRYSATHVDKYNMMYRLDSVDAYERKLVKQIEVAGIEVEDSHNKAYIRLLGVDNRNNDHKADIEMDIRGKNGKVKRKKNVVRPGDDLMEVSGGRDVYEGYIVNDIYCEAGNEYIDFTGRQDIIRLNEVVGGVDDNQYKRLQIRRTITEHLDKELILRPKGLKVLSLFFIDRVANYRDYDDGGVPQRGRYAAMFEEEYDAAIKKPKYRTLFEGVDLATAAEDVHDGYFAVDRKKDSTGSERFRESRGAGTTQADESAYQLIMRDKEKLLSLDTPLKFIFSHSALREGWDNPNVFQICTLNETTSVIKKRQEIGRGLRIAVNQKGERVWGCDVNRLTVMANESYEDFAAKLQQEIEEETGIRFGVVEKHLFASITVEKDGRQEYLGADKSQTLWDHLKEKGYIDSRGRVQDSLNFDLRNERVDLPEEFADRKAQIIHSLRKVAGDLNIRNAADRKPVKLNKAVSLSPEFRALWDRIKHRTTFRVDFDCEKLIQECADEIENTLVVGKARFVYRKGTIENINRGGVRTGEERKSAHVYDAKDFPLPDIISYLQNATNLTRRSLVRIITESRRLQDFRNNPQKYIEQVTEIITRKMRTFIVDGIRYQRIGDREYYAQELFEGNELYGYLNRNMRESSKSPFEYVVYDSDVEAEFSRQFEINEQVKVYARLPPSFKIDTPLGGYNPDWAVLVESEGDEKLYFVVESKGGMFPDTLRPTEQPKADCGREHFKTLGTDVEFCVESRYDRFSERFTR